MRRIGFMNGLHHHLPRAIRVHFGVPALILMLVSVGTVSLFAARDYPDCNWNCSARDVAIVDAYVNAPDACSPGQSLSATLYATFDNGTNSDRYAVRIIGDIYVNGSFKKSLDACVAETLGPGIRTVPLTSVSWRCGESVEVRIVTVSWASSPETCGDTPTCAARAAKCWFTPRLDVGGLPLALDFTTSSPECDGTAVSFADQTSGGDTPYSYRWDFGDGGTSTSANPSHLYATPGTYVVTLTVTERGGATGSVSHPVEIEPNPVATASNEGPYCPGGTIALTASGGSSYRWTGPNGFTSSDRDPTITGATATDAGVYTVIVSNAAGCTDQASTLVEIDSAAPALTVPADLTIECGTSTDPVQTGQATATDDTDPRPNVTYTDIENLSGCGNTGTIVRTWTATDGCGNSVSDAQTITIVDATSPTLTVSSAQFECDGAGNAADIADWLASAAGTDTCGAVTVTNDYAGLSGTCSGTGSVDVTFVATDACGNANTRTASLAVVDTTPPNAVNDAASTDEDVAVTIDVLGNDSDVCDPSPALVAVGTPDVGAAETAGGQVRYTPPAGYNGTATFSYTIEDCSGNTASALVEVSVDPVNDPPVANDQGRATPEDTPTGFFALAVSDPDNTLAELTCDCLVPPSHGTVVRGPDHTVNYTPDPDFAGIDTFTYEVCDPDGLCDTATVTVEVSAANDNPVVSASDQITPEDTPIAFPVVHSDPDDDSLSCTASAPAHGSVSPASGTVLPPYPAAEMLTYTPDSGFFGVDQIVITCNDGQGGTDSVTVEITVTPVNDPPLAQDQTRTTSEDTETGFFALLISDPDNTLSELSCDCQVPPSHGTVVRGPDHTVNYIPDPDFSGQDTFRYEVCDPSGLCDTATVDVDVLPVPDPPVANDDAVEVAEDGTVDIDVPANDSDPDGDLDRTSVTVLTQPAHGDVTVNPLTGVVTYKPDENFNGTNTFTYEICDSLNVCDTATVTVEVNPVDDPPVAVDDTASVAEDGSVTIDVPDNDSDPDGDLDVTSVTVISRPSNGTVSIDPLTGEITYEPDDDFNGADPFTYQICDSLSVCDVATVTVDVVPVPDPPVANSDSTSTPEDVAVVIDVPGNDFDVDGDLDRATVTIVSQPSNGTVSANSITGAVTYTPAENFNGTDTFRYEICDTDGLCDVADVTVNVGPEDDPPVAGDDSGQVFEDGATTIDVVENDFDPDGNLDPTSVRVTAPPAHGDVTVDPVTGEVTYKPDENYHGPDTFNYEICDSDGECDVATVRIDVWPVDDPPVANDDGASVAEDDSVVIDVADNDSDPDGDLDRTTVSILTDPAHGTVTVDAVTGKITYEPDENFNGTDTFTYQICDRLGVCDTAEVTVTVAPVDDLPVASPQDLTTPEDTPLSIGLIGSDADNEPLTYNILSGPLNGTISGFDPDTGNLIYTPDEDYNGPDSFTFEVCDPHPNECGTATVRIDVTPVNDPPVAVGDRATVAEDGAVVIDVPDNDSDPDGDLDITSVSIISLPSNGRAIIDPLTGEITYEPDQDFHGRDSFLYRICDSLDACDTARVEVDVLPVDDPPIAEDDAVEVAEDGAVDIDVPANDSDPDGDLDRTSVTVLTQPAHGDVTVNPLTGVVTYKPDENFNGTNTFTYEICDSLNVCDTATVTVEVNPVDDPPVAVDDTASVAEDGSVTIDVPDNDSDPDGDLDVTSVTVISRPSNGTVSIDPLTGEITYEPDDDFNGADPFTYQICDSLSVCDVATVTVDVVPVPDPPVANSDSTSTPEDVAVVIDVPGNDFDVDGDLDRATVTIVSQPSNGTVSANSITGAVTYTPAENFNGTDTFRYEICDTDGLCDVADVTVNVGPEDDPPVAGDDSGQVFEDGATTIDVVENDFDPDGNLDPTSVRVTAPPAHGDVTVDPVTGEVTYKPDENYHGPDTFNYEICDSDGECDVATVRIDVWPVDDPPVANDDGASVAEDDSVVIDVADNDSDPDGDLDRTTVSILTDPAHGTVTVDAVTGKITYEPDENFNGTDTFTYQICDRLGVCDTAEVTVTVAPVDDLPVASPQDLTTPEDTPLSIGLIGSDADNEPLTYNILSGPLNGTISGFDPDTGNLIYTPDEDYNGPDSFTFEVCDPHPNECGTATVRIDVTPVNDPPVAVGDRATVAEDGAVVIDVPDNDSDPDGDLDITSVSIISLPSNGRAIIDPLTGEITYEPDQDFHGRDSFLYRICDSLDACDTARVTVNVIPMNDPPVTVDDAVSTQEDLSVQIPVTANDYDPDGAIDPTTLVILSGPSHGTASVDPATGNITYEPSSNYAGDDSLVYEVCNTEGVCDVAVVDIAVMPRNDPPLAACFDTVVVDGSAMRIRLQGSDPDGDEVTYRILGGPEHGSIVDFDGQEGTFTYVPSGFVGPDAVAYEVADPFGATDRCVVQLFVVSTAGGGGFGACDLRVIISEIAWSGTQADPDHEWIELRNLEDESISLEGWTLRWRRKHPESQAEGLWKTIALSGIIAPSQGSGDLQFRHDELQSDVWWVSWEADPREDFFLLERETDRTIPGIDADLVYEEEILVDFVPDLTDQGDVIELVDPTGCVVDTANADTPEEDGWPAGSLLPAATMERIDPLVADLHENWHTNLGLVRTEIDASGDFIHGTPKNENSAVLSDEVAARGITPISHPMGEPIVLRFEADSEGAADRALWHLVVTRPATDTVLVPEWRMTAQESGGLMVEVATNELPLNEEIHVWVTTPLGELLLASVLLYPY